MPDFAAFALGFSLLDPAVWVSLVTLALMEIVLGIDNVIFISLVASRLPESQRKRARQIGLSLALVMRVALLFAITWIIGLKQPVFTAFGQAFSWRDLILFSGGLFLLVKATHEIHSTVEGGHDHHGVSARAAASFAMAIAQIAVIDLVFSVDSIITAIGMAEHIEVMIVAVLIAMIVMYVAADGVSGFIERHPSTKLLALAFLMMVGVALVADGLHFHIPRGYIYFSLAFAALIELLNIRFRKQQVPAGTTRVRGAKGGEATPAAEAVAVSRAAAEHTEANDPAPRPGKRAARRKRRR